MKGRSTESLGRKWRSPKNKVAWVLEWYLVSKRLFWLNNGGACSTTHNPSLERFWKQNTSLPKRLFMPQEAPSQLHVDQYLLGKGHHGVFLGEWAMDSSWIFGMRSGFHHPQITSLNPSQRWGRGAHACFRAYKPLGQNLGWRGTLGAFPLIWYHKHYGYSPQWISRWW